MTLEDDVHEVKEDLLRDQGVEDLERVIIAYPVVKGHPDDECPFCDSDIIEHEVPGWDYPCFACDECPWCYVREEDKKEEVEFAEYHHVEELAKGVKS